MDQYAIYLRKSRADYELEAMTKEDTLRRHKAILMELALARSLPIAEIYEEVVSGETIADRPEMKRLLGDIYQNKYRGVLVVEIERLARGDTKDQGMVADAFKYTDTLIVTPQKTYDPNNEFDEEYFEFGLFMSRREYKTISRRMQRGKIASVKEGNYIASKRPYGYDIIRPTRKERTLIERPDEAKIIRMIYHWFVDDKISAGDIARRLTMMHIPTYNGKQEWGHGTINEILHNPLYKGYVRWSYRQVTKSFDDTGNLSYSRPRHKQADEMVLAKGKHDGLISEDLWQKAQQRFREEPARVKLSTNMINPFAGLVWCAHCGRAMIYHNTKKSPGTRIRMTHRPSLVCHQKSCFYDDFVDAVIEQLQKHISDYQFKLQNGNQKQEIKRHEEMIATMEKDLQDINIRRASLFDYLERKIYSEQEFIERKTLLDAERQKLESDLEKMRTTKPAFVDYAQKIFSLNQTIDTILSETMPAKEKNTLIKSIIRRIEYSRSPDEPDNESLHINVFLY